MKPLISIIIPYYNGENYIEKCLDSVRLQEYPETEVLIIDDGSGESAVNATEKYLRKYHLNVQIIRQENQGQGAARNTGIGKACGKYICFLDQDDTLEPGILKKMVLLAEEERADIVSAGYLRETAQGKIKQKVCLKNTPWSKFRVIAPWSKLYLREFIISHKVRFLPVVLGEDIYFLMQAYSYGPKIVFYEGIGYRWLDNASSVSNTAHKELAEENSLIRLYEKLAELKEAEVLKQDKMYEYFLIKTAVWDILYTARSNSQAKIAANCNRIWQWFEDHFPDYNYNPYLSPLKPRGESCAIRIIVWGYMLLKRLHLENLFLTVICR